MKKLAHAIQTNTDRLICGMTLDMEYVLGALGLLTPLILVYLYFQKRHSRLVDDEDPILGTDAEREALERELADLPTNIRIKLAETKDIVERFSTRHGFTDIYVDQIWKSLRDQGIDCEVVFSPGAMPGVAGSLITQHGDFELWVEKTQMRQAAELLKNIRS